MSSVRPTTIAITALGGQGGGVLADWIRLLGESNGYFAQSTSVPGVAQRTGSTVYYLELFPEAAAAGREPVLSLSAVAGDVDVVIAAELMEAGRAVQRGLVTADRTLLIASSHRAYAVSEKTAMGNGIADSAAVLEAASAAARQFLHFDMQALAESRGSVISASLFGALGGSGALPFPREAFEQVIRESGVGVKASLAAFAAAWDRAKAGGDRLPTAAANEAEAPLPDPPESSPLGLRIRNELPQPAWGSAWEACRQLVDYQDARYAGQYLDLLAGIARLDQPAGDAALTRALARHLALWMAYQDAIRVASQKTRSGRHAAIRAEVHARPDELVYPVEFMHPRLEEICDLMPRAVGAWILGSEGLRNWLERFFRKGRMVQSYSLGGFLMLGMLAALRPIRRHTLRYAVEHARIAGWLERIRAAAARGDRALAIEITRCQRLLKGYSDTQARGWRNFSRIMDHLDRAPGGSLGAADIVRLREAALADEEGKALSAVLAGA
jgi:indolepyruvate ferredoxin oxidoreductase beta subunit